MKKKLIIKDKLDTSRFPGLSKRELETLEKDDLHRRWLENYLRLKLFISTHHRFPMQKEESPKGFRMGNWLHSQKMAYKAGVILFWRYKLLSDLEIDWGNKRENWNEKFEKACLLQKEKGTPLSRYSSNENERLMKLWLYAQAELIRKGELPAERVEKLYDAQLIINRIDYKWDKFFEETKAFVNKNGRLPSAHSSNAIEKSLGKLRLYHASRMKEGMLTKIQIAKMKSLGLDNKIVDLEWENKFKRAQLIFRKKIRLKTILGETGIRQSLGNELYIWWRDQRRKYREGTLSEGQRIKIEKEYMHFRISDLLKLFCN